MEALTDLLKNLEALKEAEGDFNIGLELELSTVIGALLQTRHDLESETQRADAAQQDYDRCKVTLEETQSSCEALQRTISEQSETLENRGKLLSAMETELNDIKSQMLAMGEVHNKVKADAVAMMQNAGSAHDFANALDSYALAVGRISQDDAHPMVVVTLIQMAHVMRSFETGEQVLQWLRGEIRPSN